MPETVRESRKPVSLTITDYTELYVGRDECLSINAA